MRVDSWENRPRSGTVDVALVVAAGAFAAWMLFGNLAHPLLWAVPPLLLWLPVLALAARWRKRTDADLPLRHAAILTGLLPPRNPRVVPIWWPWLGRTS